MYVGRPTGDAWLGPAGPTAADNVEFNRDHYLAPNVVAYWAARGGVLQDMLGTVGDMIADNSGVAESTTGGPSFGNLGATNRACYAPSAAAWKPTAATTIFGLFAAPPGGASGTFLFGTENSFDGWGCYSPATATPHMYMRIGAAWADVGVSGGLSQEPALAGMSFDGNTFTGRWGGNKATQSISGSITQSSFSLDFPNRGGNTTPYGGSAALSLQFIVLDRALSDDEWTDLRASPWQMLRMVRGGDLFRPLVITPITATGAFTFADMTIAGEATYTAPSSGVHGVLRRRTRRRLWNDVPQDLKPVVALAEEWADESHVQQAVNDALARYAALSARASAARRDRLIDDLKRAIVHAVERAAEADDEEALIALL